MSGGMMSVVVAANNQLVLGHVHVWSFRCTCLRFFKCGDMPWRSLEHNDLLLSDLLSQLSGLLSQCRFLTCWLSGGQGTCRKSQLPPTRQPRHLRQPRGTHSTAVRDSLQVLRDSLQVLWHNVCLSAVVHMSWLSRGGGDLSGVLCVMSLMFHRLSS